MRRICSYLLGYRSNMFLDRGLGSGSLWVFHASLKIGLNKSRRRHSGDFGYCILFGYSYWSCCSSWFCCVV